MFYVMCSLFSYKRSVAIYQSVHRRVDTREECNILYDAFDFANMMYDASFLNELHICYDL